MSLEFVFLTHLLKYEIHHNKIPFFYCDLSSYLYNNSNDNIIQLRVLTASAIYTIVSALVIVI